MTNPKVFIVILNWNMPDLTIECLKSVNELRIRNYELIIAVVDNGSTDNSIELLEKYISSQNKLDIKLIKNLKNLGYAGGNNVGIEYALKNRAEYVLILNNDTELDPGLISCLLKAAKKHPGAGVFSPKIYFAPGYEFHKKRYKKRDLGKVIWAAGGEIDWKNVYATNRGVDSVDEGRFNETKEVDFASGACMLIRSSLLQKIGGFDEKYFMYLEDTDLCMRAKGLGKQTQYVHDAQLWHKVAQSSGIGSDLNDYFITRNRLLFGMRYAPVRAKLALIRESIRFIIRGRTWQKIGARDFYLNKLGKGSWE